LKRGPRLSDECYDTARTDLGGGGSVPKEDEQSFLSSKKQVR